MSSFWSAWIIVLTLAFLVFIIWLLRWNMSNYTGIKEGELMDHEYDGIVEINNPMPKWWTILFWITIVWGFLYLALYPGLGNFAGLLGWSSSNQDIRSLEESKQATEAAREAGLIVEYYRQVDQAEEKFGPVFAAMSECPSEELAQNREAVKIGQRLFIQNCAQCHGSNAMGGKGFANLNDNDWLYGGSPQAIKQTLIAGRSGVMPAQTQFNDQQITELAT